ncbi:50S ribosomal protein L18 [candidate division WOR-1 bacterium DG_54_3]|uniref:Large ribosomal subunit protein uL18 n=1 Tax=candidate division WOR-1 bacterium DG_54_3 TaxID=1703775 RepID=A0A0S7Y524_UNCSA|nr:MAG: 50S ribosomal protein L18 [candidate division WOR-1 bacterium DG_54_3]
MARTKRIKKIFGTKERPRLSVFRSIKNIHAQIIDDAEGKTMVYVSSLKSKNGGNLAGAKQVGKLVAEKAKALGIKHLLFDRGTSRYHGRVKALAEAAREGGLIF